MTAVVFCGPTIGAADAAARSGAAIRGPAAFGDIHLAVRDGATVIGLVDGVFERVPAAWHKEILWALDAGVHVLGAASMGALRAAELASCGMVGVGDVYAAFASGALTDDDEVAVAHDPGGDFTPASEAMVDIRATLRVAHEDGVVTAAVHDRLVATAKALFYPDRTWPDVTAELPAGARRALLRWVRDNRVSVKHADARALCARVAELHDAAPVGPPSGEFHPTTFWDHARAQLDGPRSSDGAVVPVERVHDELVLTGEGCRGLHSVLRWAQPSPSPVGGGHAAAVRAALAGSGSRALVERARDKAVTLVRAGRSEVVSDDIGLDRDRLRRWWFECVEAVPVVDPARAAAASDVGLLTFDRILRRERAYRDLLRHEVVDGVLGPSDAGAVLAAVHTAGRFAVPGGVAPDPGDIHWAVAASGGARTARSGSVLRAPLRSAEAEPLRWARSLREAVRRRAGPDSVMEPRHLLVNVMLPGQHLAPHVDVPEFRGMSRRDTPNWLLLAMASSGLFEAWRAETTTAVVFLGRSEGDLELWPEGARGPVRSVAHAHDRAVVFDADRTPHGVGTLPGAPCIAPAGGDRLRSVGHGRWVVDRRGRIAAHGRWSDVRISVSWKVQVFADPGAAARWKELAPLEPAGARARLSNELVRRGLLAPGAGTDEVARTAIDTWVAPLR